MNLSKKETLRDEVKLANASKVKTLNPNAAEFVPFALRSSPSSGSIGIVDATTRYTSCGTLGKAVLHRSESSVSKNSDEEAQQYWCHQLPDDITPDFKVMEEDEAQSVASLSLAGLSLHDDNEASRFLTSTGSGYFLNDQQELSPYSLSSNSFSEKLSLSASPYEADLSSTSFLNVSSKPWDKQVMSSDQFVSDGREGTPYDGNSRHGFIINELSDQAVMEDSGVNPMELLASHFPDFAVESLAEVYFANGCDLNLTMEMLTQLELQVDVGFNQNLNSKTLSAPNLSAMDFPALTSPNSQSLHQTFAENDLQQSANSYHSSDKDNMLLFKSSSFTPSRGSVDFASAVKKLASSDSGLWKYDGNGSSGTSIGSSRSSTQASTYNPGHGRGIYSDRLQNRGSARTAPVWLETGDAVANMYSEQREEARDHARLRNAYFEQARQAYLVGNKALAKELSVKGQLHNMHMKAAHGKAQESIYRQRNSVAPETMGNGRGTERMIDLHGLHVSEAIHVLKHELSVLRSTARAADQRLQVYICVGTGHHTRGARTPARLPTAIQKYLLEEGLDYSEPQAGLLRVVLY